MKRGKKGLSPVVATSLLVLIALILAMIIFFWIKSFIGEKAQKDPWDTGAQPIEMFCEQIDFEADIYIISGDLNVSIQNNGDVPIYGVEVLKKGFASIKSIGQAISGEGGILSGDTVEENVVLTSIMPSVGNEVIITPILLGKKGTNDEKVSYVCDKKFGKTVTVT